MKLRTGIYTQRVPTTAVRRARVKEPGCLGR
jgi:hypothetical protein